MVRESPWCKDSLSDDEHAGRAGPANVRLFLISRVQSDQFHFLKAQLRVQSRCDPDDLCTGASICTLFSTTERGRHLCDRTWPPPLTPANVRHGAVRPWRSTSSSSSIDAGEPRPRHRRGDKCADGEGGLLYHILLQYRIYVTTKSRRSTTCPPCASASCSSPRQTSRPDVQPHDRTMTWYSFGTSRNSTRTRRGTRASVSLGRSCSRWTRSRAPASADGKGLRLSL